jgi:hypothetical protein
MRLPCLTVAFMHWGWKRSWGPRQQRKRLAFRNMDGDSSDHKTPFEKLPCCPVGFELSWLSNSSSNSAHRHILQLKIMLDCMCRYSTILSYLSKYSWIVSGSCYSLTTSPRASIKCLKIHLFVDIIRHRALRNIAKCCNFRHWPSFGVKWHNPLFHGHRKTRLGTFDSVEKSNTKTKN